MQIMEWRDAEHLGMQEYVAEKTREQGIQELMENKDYQEFKRQWKKSVREKAVQQAQEQLAVDMQFAAEQLQLRRDVAADDAQVAQEQAESLQDVRAIKDGQKKLAKALDEGDRAHEVQTEMAHHANQLAIEKENMVKALQYLQTRAKVNPGTNRLGARSPTRATSPKSSPPQGAPTGRGTSPRGSLGVRGPSPPRGSLGARAPSPQRGSFGAPANLGAPSPSPLRASSGVRAPSPPRGGLGARLLSPVGSLGAPGGSSPKPLSRGSLGACAPVPQRASSGVRPVPRPLELVR